MLVFPRIARTVQLGSRKSHACGLKGGVLVELSINTIQGMLHREFSSIIDY